LPNPIKRIKTIQSQRHEPMYLFIITNFYHLILRLCSWFLMLWWHIFQNLPICSFLFCQSSWLVILTWLLITGTYFISSRLSINGYRWIHAFPLFIYMILHFVKIFYVHYLRQKEDKKVNSLQTRVTQAYFQTNLKKLESST